MGTVLVTGFEAFGGEPENPSALVAKALDGRLIAGRTVRGVVLPVVFGASLARLKDAITEHAPELVLAVGQAGGRNSVQLERVAINVDDARFADNAGQQPIDVPVVEGGPVGFWSTLPIKAIVGAIRQAGIPADVSQSAGTFVCNHVFYGLLHALEGTDVRCGFVHVPFLPEQAARHPVRPPSCPLDAQIRAIEIAIITALTTRADAREAGGATH
jgi:pyroglutamyl-peptidase